MLARLQQALALLWLSAWVWGAGAAAQQGRWVACSVWAAGLLGSHALWLGVSMGLAQWRNRRDPAGPASAAQAWRAWWREALLAPRVFGWRQPFRSRQWADFLPHTPGQPGVLLVHGFVCNRGLWNPWLKRLRQEGVAHVAVDLEPVFGSIDDYAPRIEAAVRALESATGVPPLVVAHSMGGLAVRAWLRASGGDARLRRVLTLGTPHEGTWLAHAAVSANGREMRPDGDWLRALAAQEPLTRRARFVCVWSRCDQIVFPASTACLAGARAHEVVGVAHVDLVEQPEVRALAWRLLRGPAAGAGPG